MSKLIVLLTLLCLGITVHCLPFEGDNPEIGQKFKIPNKYLLPKEIVPIHYNVRLNPHIIEDNFTLEGETSVYFEVLVPTLQVVLHIKNLVIDESVTRLTTKGGIILQPREHEYHEETQMLHIQFEEPLALGGHTLYLKFEGTIDNEDLYGFYQSFYTNSQGDVVRLAVTHFQPIHARRAFPCWDEPALKATFNISIKHHANYTALSNMPAYTQEYDESDEKLWTHFETTPIMSTNILGFIVSDYVNVSNSEGTVRVWTTENAIDDARYLLEITEEATAKFSMYLNNTIRVPKMDHVAAPHYTSRATENWGLIVYAEDALLYNKDTVRSALRMSNVLTAIHEIAHHWFGNLVSPASWKYHWLSEGMATYFKYFIGDKMLANWRLMDILPIRMLQQYAFPADDRATSPLNKDFIRPQDFRTRDSSIIYGKSTAIIHMLSHIVSEDVFRAGLIKYINANEYGAVTSDDLWEAMQEALDESDVPHDNFQVKPLMDTWTEQSGFPLVTVVRNYSTGETIIRQDTSPTNRDVRQKKWWVPISIATKSNPDFSSTTPTHWLRPQDDNITINGIDENDWIIVNIQQTGYYRVNYDPQNWQMIAKQLNSNEYTQIHPVNRAQIIDDAIQLSKLKHLSPDIIVKLTNYLSRETDFIPWTTALNVLVEISKYLRHREASEILKPHISALMNNLIETVSFEERPDDNDFTKLMRSDILKWACKLGHSECQTKATEKLAAHLANPEENKISADLKYWVHCMGMMKANQSVWNQLFDLKNEELTYDELNYLGCSEDPSITENYLNMTISENSTIPRTQAADVFTFLNDDILSNAKVELDFVVANWDRIQANILNPNSVINDLLWRINSNDTMDKLKEFLRVNGINKDSDINNREQALRRIDKDVVTLRALFVQEDTTVAQEPRVTLAANGVP